MSKIMLIYPPSDSIYQRGEDRCQCNVSASTSSSLRACNDLGYMAAVLKQQCNDEVFLRDYQALRYNEFITDIRSFQPEFIVLSTTSQSVEDDIRVVNQIKETDKYECKVVLKGACFYNANYALLDSLDLHNIDILVGGEIEFIIKDIIHSPNKQSIPGIFYKNENGKFIKTKQDIWYEDLDSLPFPDRSLMDNTMYIRPDTGEPMATITSSRGCPSSCIYCLSPILSGKKIRLRSPSNIFKELQECYYTYNIRNFFFKADTFTFYEDWVLELCRLIKGSELNGKIAYCGNSRVNPLSEATVKALAETGCFMLALGIETGSEYTLSLIKKGTTIDQAKNAVALCKKYGIPTFGFYMIGFPWENMSDLLATKQLMFELNTDFIELHIAQAFPGTPMFEQYSSYTDTYKVKDYFAPINTLALSTDALTKFRNRTLLYYHLRPSYIWNKIRKASLKTLFIYAKYGAKLIKNTLFTHK